MDYGPLAALYDLQYATYRDDLHFYARLARDVGGRVLELGAGSGRVTVHLARAGVDATGLELSADMLRYARARARDADVSPRFVEGDMRDFDLGESFDLVIAPFNAFMHLYSTGDQLAALRAVRRHLAPRGRLAFDVYVPNFGPEGVLRHEGETFEADGRRTDVLMLQRVDRSRQIATTQYFVDTTHEDGRLAREHHTLTQRYFTRFELEWWLRHAGFTPKFAGSFEGGPVTDESRVLVVTATLASG
ncbi:class I SAM-dependent methyltransferase [Deinococcus yavapaiensis]|uniref:Methyltransferase family protein n=1 Tax=Deinococcus yavapaiensis KR-236 TaxID=694435 RepID=A0A318S735_9DEIO|nr:class I SAM-dependent methyltransferase [Deinococcus yavapaiensis]PYE53497.1 methyltransferase family protein [Deinococcus yavapaiensis KR-236]